MLDTEKPHDDNVCKKDSDFKICGCCGEMFNPTSDRAIHCSVCLTVFGKDYLRTVRKLSDGQKCHLYKITRAAATDEIKSITPTELHGKLSRRLDIRRNCVRDVITMLAREKIRTHASKTEEHKKEPYKCRKCGEIYLLEKAPGDMFICDRCRNYDDEHRKGTKLRDLPGVPSMTYEHLALLPQYAACMYTKYMTPQELEKLKKIKSKVNPYSKRSFAEYIFV